MLRFFRHRHPGDPDRRRWVDRRQRDRRTRASGPNIEIVGVEPRSIPGCGTRSTGDHRPCGGATIAEGIAVKNVGALTLPVCRALVPEIVLVDEAHMERAVNTYLTLQKTMAEGAVRQARRHAGAAGALRRPKVGLVLCGGNIDPRILASVMVPSSSARTASSFGSPSPTVRACSARSRRRPVSSAPHPGGRPPPAVSFDVRPKGTRLDVTLEVRDAAHARRDP